MQWTGLAWFCFWWLTVCRQGMCSNLVEKGNLDKPLIIFNRTQKRADDLSAKLPAGKSTVVSTVEEAVKKSDIIFTCVGDDKAINETIHAALANDVTGKLFVDCSTVHPETTDALAKRISAKGAGFVASPGALSYPSSIVTRAYSCQFSVLLRWQTLAS